MPRIARLNRSRSTKGNPSPRSRKQPVTTSNSSDDEPFINLAPSSAQDEANNGDDVQFVNGKEQQDDDEEVAENQDEEQSHVAKDDNNNDNQEELEENNVAVDDAVATSTRSGRNSRLSRRSRRGTTNRWGATNGVTASLNSNPPRRRSARKLVEKSDNNNDDEKEKEHSVDGRSDEDQMDGNGKENHDENEQGGESDDHDDDDENNSHLSELARRRGRRRGMQKVGVLRRGGSRKRTRKPTSSKEANSGRQQKRRRPEPNRRLLTSHEKKKEDNSNDSSSNASDEDEESEVSFQDDENDEDYNLDEDEKEEEDVDSADDESDESWGNKQRTARSSKTKKRTRMVSRRKTPQRRARRTPQKESSSSESNVDETSNHERDGVDEQADPLWSSWRITPRRRCAERANKRIASIAADLDSTINADESDNEEDVDDEDRSATAAASGDDDGKGKKKSNIENLPGSRRKTRRTVKQMNYDSGEQGEEDTKGEAGAQDKESKSANSYSGNESEEEENEEFIGKLPMIGKRSRQRGEKITDDDDYDDEEYVEEDENDDEDEDGDNSDLDVSSLDNDDKDVVDDSYREGNADKENLSFCSYDTSSTTESIKARRAAATASSPTLDVREIKSSGSARRVPNFFADTSSDENDDENTSTKARKSVTSSTSTTKLPPCPSQTDAITMEDLPEKHVCYVTPDGETRHCFALETLRKVALTSALRQYHTDGRIAFLQPTHFRSIMEDDLLDQIASRFGRAALDIKGEFYSRDKVLNEQRGISSVRSEFSHIADCHYDDDETFRDRLTNYITEQMGHRDIYCCPLCYIEASTRMNGGGSADDEKRKKRNKKETDNESEDDPFTFKEDPMSILGYLDDDDFRIAATFCFRKVVDVKRHIRDVHQLDTTALDGNGLFQRFMIRASDGLLQRYLSKRWGRVRQGDMLSYWRGEGNSQSFMYLLHLMERNRLIIEGQEDEEDSDAEENERRRDAEDRLREAEEFSRSFENRSARVWERLAEPYRKEGTGEIDDFIVDGGEEINDHPVRPFELSTRDANHDPDEEIIAAYRSMTKRKVANARHSSRDKKIHKDSDAENSESEEKSVYDASDSEEVLVLDRPVHHSEEEVEDDWMRQKRSKRKEIVLSHRENAELDYDSGDGEGHTWKSVKKLGHSKGRQSSTPESASPVTGAPKIGKIRRIHDSDDDES